MENQYGSDFVTISDDEGNEFELEILSTVEYNGATYYAVIPADLDELAPEVCILKSADEGGEALLCVVEDAGELQAVNDLLMDSLFADEDTK